jgi:hypothetical protein
VQDKRLSQQGPPEHPPIPPIPRALKNVRDVRRELVALYKQCKRYQLSSQHAGRLTFILNSIIALDAQIAVDSRMAEIEAKLAAVKANGHDRTELRL